MLDGLLGRFGRFLRPAGGRADTEAMASVWSELREELAIMRRKEPGESVRASLGFGHARFVPAGLYRLLLEAAAGSLGEVLSAGAAYRQAVSRPNARLLEVLESGALARRLACAAWSLADHRLGRQGAGVLQAACGLVFKCLVLQAYLNCRERRETPPRRLDELRESMAGWEERARRLAGEQGGGLLDSEAGRDMLMEACREVLPWAEPAQAGSRPEWEEALAAVEHCRNRAAAACVRVLAPAAACVGGEASRLARVLGPAAGLALRAGPAREALPDPGWDDRDRFWD